MIIQYIMDQDEANDHNTLFSMLEVEVVMMMMVWHNLAVVVNMAMLGKYSSSSCNSVWSGQDFKEKMKCSDEHEDDMSPFAVRIRQRCPLWHRQVLCLLKQLMMNTVNNHGRAE